MIVKNAVGEKYEVIPHVFFPTHRKRISRLLTFFADNLEKRDIYYSILTKSLFRLYTNTKVDILNLYAEREEKTTKLKEIRKLQGDQHQSRMLYGRNAKREGLDEMVVLVKNRLLEITEELRCAKIREKRLRENLRIMEEEKPW